MTLNEVLTIVLILSIISLGISVKIYLKRISGHIEAVQRDINRLVEDSTPILDNLKEITERTKRMTAKAEEYWEEIDNSLVNLSGKISHSSIVKKFYNVYTQTSALIGIIKPAASGISAFWKKLKNR